MLQRTIGKVRVVAQRAIPALTPNNRGIRMDVEVEELWVDDKDNLSTMNIYDLEPHLKDYVNLPKHNRFFQAKIDSRYMKCWENDFSKMPNLYVITILNYDPFGYDYMMYTVRNQCMEIPELKYIDGLQFIYFNTQGTKGGNQEIGELLRFIQNSTKSNATSESTRELYEYVSRIKVQPEVRLEYMRFDEYVALERWEAADEARKSDIMELLQEYGEIPEELQEMVKKERTEKVLKKWLKLAARVNSIQEFMDTVTSEEGVK